MTYSETYGQQIGLLKIISKNVGSRFEDTIDTLCAHMFRNDTSIQSCICENVTTIPPNLCNGCSNLISISFPNAHDIGGSAFSGCTKLSGELIFSKVTTVGSSAFYGCNAITRIEFDVITDLGYNTFQAVGVGALSTFIIKTPNVVVTLHQNPKSYTFKNNNDKLNVYVPDDLVESYKEATNWSIIADKIHPLSELP